MYQGMVHIGSFEGKHNWSKVRVFALLYMASHQNVKSLTYREIIFNVDIPADYLAHRLPLWNRWRFVRRYPSKRGYVYSLGKRGLNYIEYKVPGPVLSRAFQSIC